MPFIEQQIRDLDKRVAWLETVLRSRSKESVLQSEDVKQMVARFYHFSMNDFSSKFRPGRLAWARQVAMTLCVELCHVSSGDVGREFGNRDHGTVLHAIKRVHERCQVDKGAADDLRIIRESLGINGETK